MSKFHLESDRLSPSLSLPMQAEQQRIKEVQSSFQVLHRWTDKSWGEGFDVLVFPKCVIALDPNDPSSSKIIAFSHDTKVHPFYKRNSECCEETFRS